jgi:hypothetical protein
MKEDYLWDKTGEPDPEIQQLEQLLGTLRYQSRPLEIPAGLVPQRSRSFPTRFLAIAATIAIMLLGAGLWFGLQPAPTGGIAEVGIKSGIAGSVPEAVVSVPKPTFTPPPVLPTGPGEKRIRHLNPRALSREAIASRQTTPHTLKLTPQEREEAEAAREQLMLALRVASSKLNFAQKKVREINSENMVHNQHKIG